MLLCVCHQDNGQQYVVHLAVDLSELRLPQRKKQPISFTINFKETSLRWHNCIEVSPLKSEAMQKYGTGLRIFNLTLFRETCAFLLELQGFWGSFTLILVSPCKKYNCRMNIIPLHVTPFMDVRVKKAFFERDVFTQIFTLVNGVYFVWPFFAFSKDLLYISKRKSMKQMFCTHFRRGLLVHG